MIERGKLEELVARLLRETERLRNDVGVLAGRIEPFDNELRHLLPRALKDTPVDGPASIRTDKDILETIAEARTGIRSCEYALTAMRGSLDAIASDAVSREEWKPHIRPPPRRGG